MLIRVGSGVVAANFDGFICHPLVRSRLDVALELVIDFGDVIGAKKSSAQITEHYAPDALIGRQVMGVVNFPPRQIGKFMSEVLTLGFADDAGAIRLAGPDATIANGTRMS